MKSEIGEDLSKLAFSLGYHWPDDEEGQWRCLRAMAEKASFWS